MRCSTVAASLALAAGASAAFNGTVSYTTEIVSSYTTYCPYATHLTHGGATYTVTEATTLTITNCPCTITKPVAPTGVPVSVSSVSVVSVPSVSVPSVSVPTVTASVPVGPPSVSHPASTVSVPHGAPSVSVPPPVVSTHAVVPPPIATSKVPPPVFANSTKPAPAPTGTGSHSGPASPSISGFTGAGSRVAASGASLIAVMGLAALFL